ncbi:MULTISPECIES: hypothetical protein [unclassified Mesorhizobium]|uniref:hypothetical protein n=1 Tax=unclassified Mesorhizobium TaxID=325217 RepID=UPI000A8B5446|nr:MULTISPECIES: hypothetical protein [unclassified Mesorhizobium]
MADKVSGRVTRRKAAPQPAGKGSARPGRAKKTLGDDFLAAVRADFRSHGAGVLAAVRADKPEQYLKIVLSVLPRDFNAAMNSLDTLSDDEIRSRIRALESTLGPGLGAPDEGTDLSGAAPGTGAEAGPEQAG